MIMSKISINSSWQTLFEEFIELKFKEKTLIEESLEGLISFLHFLIREELIQEGQIKSFIKKYYFERIFPEEELSFAEANAKMEIILEGSENYAYSLKAS